MNSRARDIGLINFLKSSFKCSNINVEKLKGELIDEISALDSPNISTLTIRTFTRDGTRGKTRKTELIQRHIE